MSIKSYLFSFYNFLFSYSKCNPLDILQVYEVDVTDSRNSKNNNSATINAITKRKVVVLINITFAIICLITFGIICYYCILLPNHDIPEFLQNTFMLTLGYYGSAFLTFFEKN